MEMFNNIYDFPSWEEAMDHVRLEHGEAGRMIVLDPDSAPIMWHEFAHSDPVLASTFNHHHTGHDLEALANQVLQFVKDMEDPAKQAEFTELAQNLSKQANEYYKNVQ